ncbi:MAG: translation elongation factor Ts [Elusimicrobia bacterium]|nr:translation elongation factor Ts [Elusimicrobiota bacterium]
MISANDVAKLREKSGAGLMDCKRALSESAGDIDRAVEILRKKGLAGAAQKANRSAKEGAVATYLHHSGKVGVMVELNCETDFVARTAEFQDLAKELALQIAASNPRWIRREDVPASLVEKEKDIYKQQAANSGKPAQAHEKIIEGKLAKFYSEACLLEQSSIRDTSGKTTVGALLTQAVAKMSENLTIRRFARFQVGEDWPA